MRIVSPGFCRLSVENVWTIIKNKTLFHGCGEEKDSVTLLLKQLIPQGQALKKKPSKKYLYSHIKSFSMMMH